MSDKRSPIAAGDVLFFLFFSFLLFVWFHNVIVYDNVFSYCDLGRYFYPLRHFAADAVRSGRIPLWNPYVKNGTPLLATLQGCIFYPISVIFYIVSPFYRAFNWYIILHFFLASGFMYILMRRWKFSRIASAISSMVFAFGGYLSSVITMNTSLSSVIWLPLVILFFDMAIRRLALPCAFFAGIFLGIQFLGGEPTIIYATLWFLFFYCLAFSLSGYSKNRDLKEVAKRLGLFAATSTLWIFITAIQLVPFAEFLMNSTRARPEAFESVTRWSLLPSELFNFFIPFLFGETTKAGGSFAVQDWMASFYIGIFPLFLVFCAVIFKPDKKTLFLAATALASLVLAMGRYTPMYRFLYDHIPGFGHIRYPVKFIFMASFLLSILSGIGYEKFIKRADYGESGRFAGRLLLFNGFLALSLIVFLKFWNPLYKYLVKNFVIGRFDIIPNLSTLSAVYFFDSAQACRLFIVATAALVPAALYLKKRIRPSTFAFLGMSVIFMDLVGVNMGISGVSDRRLFLLEPPAFAAVKQDKTLFRVMQTDEIIDINKSIWGPDFAIGQYERKESFAANIPMEYGIFSSQGYESLIEKGHSEFMDLANGPGEAIRPALVNLLNVKYVISARPIRNDYYEVVYRGEIAKYPIVNNGRIYRYFYINKNKACMERAFLAKSAVIAKDDKDSLEYLKDEGFDPAEQVVLEEEPVPSGEEGLPCAEEEARIIRYEPEDVVIEAALDRPKFLILSDSYYPGWKVYVDGKRGKIYKAYHFLRAVYLRTGRHEVKFVFDPLSYKMGKYISLAALAAISILICISIIRWYTCCNMLRYKKGFTLTELVMVIIIVAVLAVVVVPRMVNIEGMRLDVALDKVAADMKYAREFAMNHNQKTRVAFDAGVEHYDIEVFDPQSNAWNILVDPSTRENFTVLLNQGEYRGVHIVSAAFDGHSEIEFNSYGAPFTADGAMANTGIVTLGAGDGQSSVSVTPVTGRIEIVR